MKREYRVTIHSIGLATAIISQGARVMTNRKTVPLGQVEFYPDDVGGGWIMIIDSETADYHGIVTPKPAQVPPAVQPSESASQMVVRVTADDRYPTQGEIAQKLGGETVKSVTGNIGRVTNPNVDGKRLLSAAAKPHNLSAALDNYPEIDYGASADFSESDIKLDDSDLK